MFEIIEISKMNYKKLSEEEFLKTFEHVPRVGISLLVKDKNGRILLTKRAKPPLEGLWHIPGSFLFKLETINDCLQRVAIDELNLNLFAKPQLLGVFDNIDKDPRGHVVDIVYGATVGDDFLPKPHKDTLEAKFFDKLPSNIGFNHAETLKKLGYA